MGRLGRGATRSRIAGDPGIRLRPQPRGVRPRRDCRTARARRRGSGKRRAAAAGVACFPLRRSLAARTTPGALRRRHQSRSSRQASRRSQTVVDGDRSTVWLELDSEWRDRAGLNACGPAEASYMKKRTVGHTETAISGDTRADWSEAFELVPSLDIAYVWHASVFTREVLNGLLNIGFLYPQQIIWNKGRTVLTRTHYWYQHEPCWYVRKKNAPWFGKAGENSTIWDSPSPKFIMGGSDEEKFDHPTQKPVELMRRPILNHIKRGEIVYEPFLGSGTTLAAAELTERVCYGIELDPKYVDVVVQRWQTLSGKKAKLEGDGRTFEEIAEERKAAV